MLTVIVSQKGAPPRRIEIDKLEVTIGRRLDNDVVLPAGNVSSHHARLVVQAGKVVLVDLQSTNGTSVNGQRLSGPRAIGPADRIQIGEFTLSIEEGPTGAAFASAPSSPAPVGMIAPVSQRGPARQVPSALPATSREDTGAAMHDASFATPPPRIASALPSAPSRDGRATPAAGTPLREDTPPQADRARGGHDRERDPRPSAPRPAPARRSAPAAVTPLREATPPHADRVDGDRGPERASAPQFPSELLRRAAPREARLAGAVPADCAVFSQTGLALGEAIVVRVFLYPSPEEPGVRAIAREEDPAARRVGWKPLGLDLRRGARIWLRLDVPGLVIDEPEQILAWQGRSDVASFGVVAPRDGHPGNVLATLSVAADGLPLGTVRFVIEVTARPEAQGMMPRGHRAHGFRKAFVSYSSHDRIEVLKRVQMLRAQRVEFFQDVLDLSPGERWERELYRRIDECDVFYLFWSSAAKSSEWVEREARYALERKGGSDESPPEIVPIPIEGPPVPPPPSFLAHLHFNDALLSLIQSG